MFSGLTHLTDLSTDSRFATLLGYTPEELDGPLVFNRIRASGKLPEDLEHVPADPMTLDVCDALTLPVESLLYQSGYLTIKEVVPAPECPNVAVAAAQLAHVQKRLLSFIEMS